MGLINHQIFYTQTHTHTNTHKRASHLYIDIGVGAVSSRTPQWGKVRSEVIGDINQQIRSQLRSSAPVSEKRRISACVRPVKNKRRGGHTINQSKRLEKKRCERIKKATSGGVDFDARHSCQLFLHRGGIFCKTVF